MTWIEKFLSLNNYLHKNGTPLIDFRIFRDPEKIITKEDIARLAVIRYISISRNLGKRWLAVEIINLLKSLQMKYNPESQDKNHGGE